MANALMWQAFEESLPHRTPEGLRGPLAALAALLLFFSLMFAWNVFDRPGPKPAPLFAEIAVPMPAGGVLFVGREEVTWSLWRQCHDDRVCDFLPRPGLAVPAGDFPVTGVNMPDIDRFLAWVALRTGTEYRLPTLKEWRAFAGRRADGERRKLFEDPRLAWAADYGSARRVSRKLKPSGSFGLASSGVADISGNVWEWTSTCAIAGVDTDRCPAFVVAGEHEADVPLFLRDAFGGGCTAGVPPANLGFRLVRD